MQVSLFSHCHVLVDDSLHEARRFSGSEWLNARFGFWGLLVEFVLVVEQGLNTRRVLLVVPEH